MVNSALRVGFIGAGHTGTILAHGLNQAGYRVEAVASRSYKSAETLANKPMASPIGQTICVRAAA